MKAIEVFAAEQKIVMSSAFEKKARKFGSPEYKMLREARLDNPGYSEEIRQFKTNTKQDRYKGLTYNGMREYIRKAEGDKADSVLVGFEALIDISKCHSNCRRYSTVKEWFLKRYPEIKEFGMDEEKMSKFFERKAAAAAASNSEAEKKEQTTPATEGTNVTEFPASEQENSEKKLA